MKYPFSPNLLATSIAIITERTVIVARALCAASVNAELWAGHFNCLFPLKSREGPMSTRCTVVEAVPQSRAHLSGFEPGSYESCRCALPYHWLPLRMNARPGGRPCGCPLLLGRGSLTAATASSLMSSESCCPSDALVGTQGQHQRVSLRRTDGKLHSPQAAFPSTRRLESHICQADKASHIIIPT